MFVAYNLFSTINARDVDRFADPGTFPDAFADEVMEDSVWRPNILIDDDYRTPGGGTLNLSANCYLLYAKDKETLKDGLKACPLDAKFSAGTEQIGFFCGAYDFEKLGAWHRSNQKAAKSWSAIESERRYGMADHQKGLKKHRHDTMFNRLRLKERGYFVLVCRSRMLVNVRKARKMIGSEITLSGLGRMISGRSPKMSREQALGVLMDDLLIA